MAIRIEAPSVEELEQRAEESHVPGVVIVSDDEWYALFDDAVRNQMMMSGEEFIEHWNAGDYDVVADTAGHRHIIDLAMLIPSDRRKR